MRSWKPREAHLHKVISRSAEAATKALAAKAPAADVGGIDNDDVVNVHVPDPIKNWLAQLRLLYGVPFEYLIADARLLPVESIRFFYVDRNWTDLLVDGALSIGPNTTSDLLQTEAAYESVQRQLDELEPLVRNKLRGKTDPPSSATVGGTLTGFLFRSVVVSGWPSLEVKAYPKGSTTPLDLFRMDHLAPDILLCIFNGVPDRVDVIEPGEGLHFGVLADYSNTPTAYDILMRGLGYGGFPAGIEIKPQITSPVQFRQGAGQPGGVLNVADLAAQLQQTLHDKKIMDPSKSLTSAEFAIQMVKAAGVQSFTPQPQGAAADDAGGPQSPAA